MGDILIRSGCFIAIIVLGYVLRCVGFFQADAFHFLSRIVMNITLPAAVISSMAGRELEVSMLSIALLGFGFGAVYVLAGFLLNLNSGKEQQAFEMINLSGYNIGNFALPFLQSFLGPVGTTAAVLLDSGNTFICLGGSYGAASAALGGGDGAPLKRVFSSLFHSVPFLTYLVMVILSLLRLSLPSPVVTLADTIAGANVFLSMLMIGVGFQLSGDRKQLGAVARVLLIRFGIAAVLALVCYFALPLALEYRKALAILVFSPITTAATAFTADLKGDVGLSCSVNSLSILFSIFSMIVVLMLVQ